MYFNLCFVVFSIMIIFNALCDAYIVERQSYTVLLKRNRILCLIMGKIFGNYFLTIYSKASIYGFILSTSYKTYTLRKKFIVRFLHTGIPMI